jgi:omega-6 fatty acid desaturase (delta-12 desaturase)
MNLSLWLGLTLAPAAALSAAGRSFAPVVRPAASRTVRPAASRTSHLDCASAPPPAATAPSPSRTSIALEPPRVSQLEETVEPLLSGLNGKALRVEPEDVPTKGAVRAVVPDHCFKKDTRRSMAHLAQSAILTAACTGVGLAALPLKLGQLFWAPYAAVTGTVAMGLWVLAHECGHGAFSDNRFLQDAVGYLLHSLLLVPYFSWQRSHAVHHAHTNHLYKGETHVPTVVEGVEGEMTPDGETQMNIAKSMGARLHGAYQAFGHLTIGWPSYILFGLTGGAKYTEGGRICNHFWPGKPFSTKLWPGRWASKVVQSSAGVAAVLGLLALWAKSAGAATVCVMYGGPYMVVNMWLIVYTWLQHTDVDVPHLHDDDFTYMRGAFLTIDRPYPPLIDWLHHRIGTTHVAHHIDCSIPHYHAREATAAIAKAFPKPYLFEPTPVHKALWRVCCHCAAVKRRSATDSRYVFVPIESWA